MTEQDRKDAVIAVWRELQDVRGRCWRVGVGDVEATPEKLLELGTALLGLGRRLLEAGKEGR